MSRSAITTSVLSHAVLVLLLFSVTFPQTARQIRYRMTPLFAPEPAPPAPKRRQPSLPRPVAPRPMAAPSRLSVPSAPAANRPPLPELPSAPAAPIAAAPQPVIETPREIAPPAIRTGGFEPAPVAVAPPLPSPKLVQTGSFGAADRATGAKPAASRTQVASAGFGGPAVADAPRANLAGAASTGAFGSAVAAPTQPAPRRQVSGAQFDSVVVKPTAPSTGHTVSAGRFTPLEILQKPRPAYSEEARRLQIEGEVVLEALFSSSGRIRVMRVVKSLGHGLDESAIQAAAGIRFRPATENGSPQDMVAVVKIAFQLAY
jgi:TonB family protein